MIEVLRIENLTKRYRNFALHLSDLSLGAGRTIGLIGENGSGKTTLIKGILGLVRIESGSIFLPRSNDTTQGGFQMREHVGYVPEDQILYEWMSVGETLRFYSAFYPSWEASVARDLMELFRLKEQRRVGDLSKGMKVKLLLILALAHQPEVLLLDEPTAGLDPIVKDEFLDHLLFLRQKNPNLAILISSHILSDIEDLADDIVILHNGNVVLEEPKAEISETWRVVRMPNSMTHEFDSFARSSLVICSARQDDSLYLLVRAQDTSGREEIGRWKTEGAELRPASLREIYLGLVRQRLRV